jgi:hypothetical protein
MPRTARVFSGPSPLLLISGAAWGILLFMAGASTVQAAAATGSIRSAGGPELVIYNDDMALVREPKTLELPRGVSQVTLEGVAQRLDSTSVRLEGPGFRVMRQSFRYDLWNGDKVFRRFLGDTIIYRYNNKVYRGLLAGIDGDDLFIQRHDSADVLTMLKRSQVTEVEFPSRLKLSTRPSLSWVVDSEKGGDQAARLSYLTAGVRWNAEYTAVLDAQEKNVELTGWATIVNRSGVSFTDVPEKNYYAFVPGKPTDDSQFPDLAQLKDDQPPQTIVTFIGSPKNGQRLVRGTATDNRHVATVKVNGQPATSLRGDFSEWQVELPLAANVTQLVAEATDTAANVELRPHIIALP